MDIADWLRNLGLERYEAAFRRNGVIPEVLSHLTAEDLRELGVAAVGHRRQLLVAIAKLSVDVAAPQVAKSIDNHRRWSAAAERRQLTVLFCDIVGSTPLSTGLDPEELSKILTEYQANVGAVVTSELGYIAQFVGDGVLAYFGWPNADESHAESAVRAGLAIVEAIGPQRLSVRVGIATGLVVTGDLVGVGAARTMTAVGQTPNLASRLQDLARPDTVVVCEATRAQLGQMFELEGLGLVALKGFATPMRVWRVLRKTGAASRSEVVYRSAVMPLIGRDDELGLLLRKWHETKVGEGRLVLLSGEPGIGKSRLLAAMEEGLAAEPHLSVRYFCSPLHQDSALHPIVTYWERVAGFARTDLAEHRLRKLESVLAPAQVPVEDVALIAALLSIPTGERYPQLDLIPEQRKRRTFAALLHALSAQVRSQPLLVLFEDAHWADPTSLELLDMLIDRLAEMPILLAISFRPEFAAPWSSRVGAKLITLSPLDRHKSAALATQVAPEGVLTPTVLERIVAQADGVPLFIEELTKAVHEARTARETVTVLDAAPQPLTGVPATLNASLMARLDRLGSTKEVAQIGAVIGRTFDYELLATASGWNELELAAALQRLVETGLVFIRGTLPDAEYTFKHALVQDAAYESLLRTRRQEYHRQIAQTLEERFSEVAEAQPQLLAHHYAEAGIKKHAIPYLQAAAQKAAQQSANAEAISHLTKALELLTAMPEAPERLQQELALQLALGTPLIATKGFASQEVRVVYARARELCQKAGDALQLFPVLWGLWVFYTARAEHGTALELARQCRRLAEGASDPALLVESHHALGVTLLAIGEFSSGLEHLEQAISIYDPHRHASLAFAYGQDSGVVCRAHAAWALWFLGYPDQAMKKSDEALILARQLSHPYSLVVALDFAAWVHQFVRNHETTKKWAEAATALATQHAFAFWIPMGMILQGWALAAEGQAGDGIAQIRDGLTAFRATGAEIMRPYYLALLAETYAQEGQFQEGLSVLVEAQTVVDGCRECWWAAELVRLKGELMLKQLGIQSPTSQKEAERCFHDALSIASRQNAKSLELRAAMSLGRLWQREGKRQEARQMLSDAYARFTEGFNTADLLEARALLTDL